MRLKEGIYIFQQTVKYEVIIEQLNSFIFRNTIAE